MEQKKFDGTPFDTESPEEGFTVKSGAKFMYCKSLKAWVFTHEYIRKSKHEDSDCPWLLRSEETFVYDIEEVEGSWQIWVSHSPFHRFWLSECHIVLLTSQQLFISGWCH